ncbi:polymorphic toxin-type HINT domain-containing protein [Moraxella catarrhalis]|uniref:polymorphic toxin-type HINT domain-containing protein n=1 Tax=Moraxella catarrhalis TaxID=480 RepID=UPI0009B689F0|nr:polymorphic toxin-type HINT domain-containing protein [Moraxella catarrhalis]
MILLDRNNQEVEVISQYLLPNHTETVYNFEVQDFHTYHIGEYGVWVHNDGCCDLSNLKTINTRHYADKVTQKECCKKRKNTVVKQKSCRYFCRCSSN